MVYREEPYDSSYFFRNRTGGYSDYTAIQPAYWIKIADDIETQLGSVSGIRTLDAGCAFGFLTNELANRGADIDGIDFSSYAIAEAQSRFPLITFQQADAAINSGIPYGVNTFHIIVAVGLTDCMPDELTLDSLLQEINRVLHPQGTAYVLGSEISEYYLTKTTTNWNNKVIGNRTVTATSVGNMLPWDTRILVE